MELPVTISSSFWALLFSTVTPGHAHLPDVLLSQEVPDLDQGTALCDGAIDGEMSVDGPHLEQESIGDTLEQVLDVAADGPDGSDLLLLSEPLLYLDGHFVGHVDVHGQVLEALDEGSPGSLHGHNTGLNTGLQPLRNSNQLKRVQFLHFSFS